MKPSTIFILTACLPSLLGGCKEQQGGTFQGYVEGEYIYLASSQPGHLQTLAVERGSSVTAKTLLFELESDNERHALRQSEQELLSAKAKLEDMETGRRPEEIAMAQAQLEQAKSEAANAAVQLRRYEKLSLSGSVSKAQLDDARAAAQMTTARVAELTSQVDVDRLPERKKQIEAQQADVQAMGARVAQARWNLDQKRISSPADGLVYDTLYRVGEWVAAGSPVVQMLPPENVKIRFFVPETLIGRLLVGNRISVQADGREKPFSAVISYVADNAEYTPPVIYSNETRSKLVFMVEAKPVPETAASLHPGQPVSVNLP